MAPKMLSLHSARPYAYKFALESTALIIIDIQRDFVDPGGFGSIQCGDNDIFSKARSIVPVVQRVLETFRQLGGHVIHTREGHQPDLADLPAAKKLRQVSNPSGHHTMGIGDHGPMGRLLIRGEWGHDIIDELTPWPTESVIDKPGKGSFWGTELHRVLLSRGITHLLFAGVTTECCVTTTLRECADRGFECCILSDCTAGFDAQQVTTSMDIICGQDGLFGYIGHSSDFHSVTQNLLLQHTPPSTPPILNELPEIDQLLSLYKRSATSPTEIVNLVFDRIEAYKAEDASVWIALEMRDNCLNAAKELENRYAGRALPPLYGIPFSVKDTIDVAGVQTTAACPSYAYMATTHAPVIQHLIDAGGLYIGKVNLDQLATGLSGCRSPFGEPHSTYSNAHIAGGSSSGSAVSVGAKLVSFSLGTDTAGSGRVPACFNGVTGLKPTKGTVSARGLIPACKTLDTISVMSQTVSEARRVWQVIAQYDYEDPYAKPPHTLVTWKCDFRGPRLGGFTFAVPPSAVLEVCSRPYQDMFVKAVEVLRSCGGMLVDIDYSIFEEAGELLYNGALLHERIACIGVEFLQNQLEHLHPTTRKLFSTAMLNPPTAFTVFRDQDRQAVLTRKAQRTFDTLNGGIDVLIVPTTTCHPTIEEMARDPIGLNSKLGTFTHSANVVDLCGISVPAGEYWSKGSLKLPFAVTLLGGSGYDAKLLDIAAVFEECVKPNKPRE